MRHRFLLAAVAALLLVPVAAAHANYLSSEPARGARLDAPPGEIRVTLSEDVDSQGSSLEVRDMAGHRLEKGPTKVENGATPVLTVPVDIPGPGSYTVTWISLSSVDGHSTRGTFGFAVGDFEPPATVESSGATNVGGLAGRALMYAGFALALGSLAFRFGIDPGPSPRRRLHARVLVAGTALLASGILVLVLDTKADAGLDWSALAQSQVGSSLLRRLVLAILAVPAAVWATTNPTPRRLAPAAVLVGSCAFLSSRLGHPADHGWTGTSLDFLHLVSAAVWTGGLLLMAHALAAGAPTDRNERTRVAHRFSHVALVCVAVLVASGVVTGILVLGTSVVRDPASLMDHAYGRFLLWKIGLLAGMLVLASVNRFVHLGEGPLPRRKPAARTPGPRMARAVALEALLGVAVLGVAALLTAGSPPYAAAQTTAPWSARGEGEAYAVALEAHPVPSEGGTSNLTLHIRDRTTGDQLAEAVRVRFVLSWSDAPELGSEQRIANQTGNGTWSLADFYFSRAGNASVVVEVQTQTVYLDRVPLEFRVDATTRP
jgi:copper transport protein